MSSLYDVILLQQTLMESYSSQGYNEFQTNLRVSIDKINERISKTKGVWTTQKLNSIKRLINDEITKSYGGLFTSMQDESVSIATMTYNSILATSFSASLPTNTVKELTNSNRLIQMGQKTKNSSGFYSFQDLFDIESKKHEVALRSILASGVNSGLTLQQITSQLSVANGRLSKGQIGNSIRTIIFDSMNQGNYKGYSELEKTGVIKFYEHISVLDSNTSEICQTLDGRKYYMPFEEIPLNLRPTIHGNCRSKLVPRTTEKVSGKRASQFGEVPSNETYPKWFSRQSDDLQLKVLGKRKFEAYKQGNYKITSLADVTGRSLSLDSIQTTIYDFAKLD